MQRKIWHWVFIIFVVIVVGTIAITLVCYAQKDEKEDSSDEQVYATSFYLNLPSTITMQQYSSAELKDGYLSITPASAKNLISYEIKAKNNSDPNGISFENNEINANKLGTYSIAFTVIKSESSYFTRTLNISVVEESSHITQKVHSVIINETESLNNLFIIYSENYKITTDENLSYNNNNLIAQSVGVSTINFFIDENYVSYIYTFSLIVKDEPIYTISLANVTDNKITIILADNDCFQINCNILNRDEENVEQDINVISSNENIVIVEHILSPLIKIKALQTGETNIRIQLVADETIFIDIIVIVN